MQPTVSPEELRNMLAAGTPVTVVDVREAEELEEGFIPGSIHIPHLQIEHYASMLLPNKEAIIVVTCATGRRATIAAETLRSLGYSNVQILAGGFEAWST